MAVMPALSRLPTRHTEASRAARPSATRARPDLAVFLMLALVLTISSGIGSVMVVSLLTFLQAKGVDFATAVTLGTLFGPAQVGARFVERLFGTRYHPLWTMVTSCVLMAVGLGVLLTLPVLVVAILIYAGGYGIMWIARGTVPLALFGPDRYATLMGRLAFPSLISQALAPSAGALLIEHSGPMTTLEVLLWLALLNVLLVGGLWAAFRRSRMSEA
jgi:hypothetical protein